jgi:hypothetical protein
MEPAIYDLLTATSSGFQRVQVKTTTGMKKNGWEVGVGRRPYSEGNRAPSVRCRAEGRGGCCFWYWWCS